jgi:hypothetical protein
MDIGDAEAVTLAVNIIIIKKKRIHQILKTKSGIAAS